MGTEESGTTKSAKKIEDIFKNLEKQQREQERAAYAVSKAMKDLSESAIADLSKDLKKLAKDNGLLNDQQIKLIKTTKDLEDALAQQEKGREKEIKEAKSSLVKLYADLAKVQASLSRKASDANKQAVAETQNLISVTEDEIKQKEKTLESYKASTTALIDNAKASDKLTRVFDNTTESVKGWAKENLTLRASFKFLKEGLVKQVSELNKATNVGLQSSFVSIGLSAVQLKMTFDEFSELVSKNRDVINQLGGGTKGINNFSNMIDESSKRLSYMGKDGIAATGRFVTTLKTMGVSTKDQAKYKASMRMVQDRFAVTSKMYGDTAEQYADVIESQMAGEGIQSQLNTLNDTQRDGLRKEILLRTENLKAMGMSNDQIKQFNSKLENLYNPRKNDQGEKVKSAEFEKAALIQLAELSGSAELKANLPKLLEAAEKKKYMNPKQIANMEAAMGDAYRSVGKAQSMVDNQQEKMGAGGSFYQAGLTAMKEGGGARVERLFEMVQLLTEKDTQGAVRTPDDKRTAEREVLEEMKGNVGIWTNAVKGTRDIMQTLNAVMESSIGLFGTGLVLSLGAASFSLLKFKKALDIAAKSAGALPNGAKGIKGMLGQTLKGLAGGLLGMGLVGIGANLVDSLLGSMGVGDEEVDDTKDAENWNRMTALQKMGSGLARGLEGVGNIIGMTNVSNAAKAARFKAESKMVGTESTNSSTPTQSGLTSVDPSQPSPKTVSQQNLATAAKPSVTPTITGMAGLKGFKGFGSEMDSNISEASKKYGLDEATLRGFVKMEGGWTGRDSPTGPVGVGQFTEKTWNDLAQTPEGKSIGMEMITSQNRKRSNDPRRNNKINTMATALLAQENAKILANNNLPATGENLYMLHNIGPGVLPALKGSDNVTARTQRDMNFNGKHAGQSPTDFVKMQKGKFNTHYALANGSNTPINQPLSGVQVASTSTTPIANQIIPGTVATSTIDNLYKGNKPEDTKAKTENPTQVAAAAQEIKVKPQDKIAAELEAQTSLLKTIAFNTSQSYKPLVDKRLMKDSPALVQNNYP
jgi:hypothetical protein